MGSTTHVLSTYDDILEPIAQAGIVVLLVQRVDGIDTEEDPVQHAADGILCGLRWLTTVDEQAWEHADEALVGCEITLGGHAEGAEAAYRISTEANTTYAEALDVYGTGFRPNGLLLVAPTFEGTDPPDERLNVPMLVLAGSRDTVVAGQPVALYDNTPNELPGSLIDAVVAHANHALWWVHGASHFEFGGHTTETTTRGRTIAADILDRFVRFAMAHDETQRPYVYGDVFAEALADPTFWEGLPPWDDDDFSGGVDCTLVSPPCDTVGCAEFDDACVQQPAIRTMYTTMARSPIALFEDEPPIDASIDISATVESASASLSGTNIPSPHDTTVLSAAWEDAGTLAVYANGASMLDMTHLSLRTGSRTAVTDSMGTCVSGSLGHMDLEVEFRDTMIADGDPGPQLPIRPIVMQDYPAEDPCEGLGVMQTVRVSLADVCPVSPAEPEIGDALSELRLHFPDLGAAVGAAAIDTVELVQEPGAPTFGSACGDESGAWICETTGTLDVVETACDTEPISGACPVLNVVTNPVDHPHVDLGNGFDGWLVYTMPGVVEDPQDPTVGELAYIDSLCVRACEQEYASDPFVAANCDASGAFETPVLARVGEPTDRPFLRIPQQNRDGSGLWPATSLPCDLADDCCDGFNESVCPAAPSRVTVNETQLERGEEWVVTIEGAMQAASSYAPAWVAADLEGTIGFSECTAGNDNAPCPFYVGSMEFALVEPLAIELTCNSVPQEHELTELEIRLVQPAIGMQEEDGATVGFPPGGLVLEGTGVVDSIPFHVVRAIEQPVYLEVTDSWPRIQGVGGFLLEFQVPCNGEIADVTVWWGFEGVGTSGSPPTAAPDLPGTVSCPGTIDLDANCTDPDGDIGSERWVVDGVLIEDGVTSIPFTTGHELTLITRDLRGATSTATESVACQ